VSSSAIGKVLVDARVWLRTSSVPKGTPNDIVQKLNLEIGSALKDPEFARQISTIGIDPLGSTPDEFAAFLRKEIPRWKQIVQDADVKVEEAH
jgi:tripartite-type tricarboxylate transporter receptor subunit TctC